MRALRAGGIVAGTMRVRSLCAALVAASILPVAAGATPRPFTGPANWDHAVAANSEGSTTHSELWKNGDGETLTLLSTSALNYDDVIAAIHKNVATLHPSVDRDLTCSGRRAHEIEMAYTSMVTRQLIVDDVPGVTRLTLIHPADKPATTDVMAALQAYCGT